MRRLIESLLAVSWNRERKMKGFSMRGAVIRIIKRTKVVASALALFVLFFVPWHGWSFAAAASNVTYPVIFIHGIHSDASTWDSSDPTRVSFRKKLEGWGWTFGGYPEYRDGVTIISKTPADFYILTFSDDLDLDMNLSIAQRGAELYEIIKKVREINNNAQKVRLVGHSMGGLAARAYLQGLGLQDLFSDDVQSLVTIGTPHQGSWLANLVQDNSVAGAEIRVILNAAGVDAYSTAVTELRYDSCAIKALNYDDMSSCVYDSRRPTTEFNVSRRPPNDVTYTSIIGEALVGKNAYGLDCPHTTSVDFGDGIVSASSQNFIFSNATKSATISTDCSMFPQVHTLETSDNGVWAVLSPILAGYKTQSPPPPPPPLSPPTNFQISPPVSVAGDTINASWIGVAGADGYTASYGYSPGIYAGDIPLGNTTSYSSSTIPPATYYIALRAYKVSTGAQSGYSNEVKIVVSATTAPAPTISGITPNPVTGSTSPITFTVTGGYFVSGTKVQVGYASNGYTFVNTNTDASYVNANTLTVPITTSTQADTWHVRVINPDGQTSSSYVNLTVVAPTTTCTYPGAFSLSVTPYWDTGYPHSIAASLIWAPSSNATSGYTIYRDGSSIYGPFSGTTFLNNPKPPALLAGSSHSYYIVASNTCGNTQSNTVSVTLTAQATVSNSGGGLNLRSSPGYTSTFIAKLPDGTTVTVNGGPTSASVSSTSSGWWWYVNTSYGSGWVWGDYLY